MSSAGIVVKLVQGSQPALETSLEQVFVAAVREAPGVPQAVAVVAAHSIGRGATVAVEAEKGGWTRYRVAIRVQGMPVTIGTVEVTER